MELDKERKIPKTLGECLEIDPLSKNLWDWAENLEKFGAIILLLIIIAGIVFTGLAVVEADYNGESLLWRGCSTLFTWVFYAIIEYCVYHALSLLMSALATIVQNTTISANVAAYKAGIERGAVNRQTATNQGNLYCPQCLNPVKYGDSKCHKCGQVFDWSKTQR